ncbi:GspE/PulE family protein [Clostridium saccharobutylicum]|uniref:Type IV pilus assembly protein TapB n=1 Tax=Clostridium saccharobutylicum DSM 13864 TaxID=1345695 RepID=U5MMW7_CLOSA|nr:GspE/PulE family protein [Clostridium saccharobutylicum]AGX42154.1 type IV pilus assembly protein TapB [Clostridium saccharobutylicum DSM 13864]AQR89434.1 type II secretion system protein E [Clostridium saccharobutylicum]AQR99336.1 type II secretion system protein E [Clostridium saccharobutylicum]AQS13322.1 type II secretion system protein E [Clostridium saccharobutylicum]MBA2904489.1 type IV pilus assembly protein PilB [Clostridium saccharobutylicum]
MATEKRRLGNILVNAGKITGYQLQEALKSQKALGKKLGEILLDSKIVTEDDIIESIEQQTGIKKVDLNTINFDRKAITLIPENLCDKYILIPFGFDNNKIKVALSDPLNIFAIDDVAISTGFEIESFIAKKKDICKFIGIYYSSQQVNNAVMQLSKESNKFSKNSKVSLTDMNEVNSAPVVKMVESMFKNSIEMNASDIHIEPFENEVRIRYRIDGKLKIINTLGIESLGTIVTRIKILAGLNIAEKRIPQDGRTMVTIDNMDVDLRVSVLPVVNGEKIVIRILNTGGSILKKEQLGMGKENIKKLNRIISNPHGIILVTGPTGSGKSTSLYSILSELNSSSVNIITVEDPVEYTMNGINQVSVNEKAGLTFASGLRSILRQDPDIVMIGEIRDEETAEIATRAAITGHLVLSTLHTNDAPSSIARLIDMGVKPYLVSTSVVGVMAQRLVRKICDNCKEEYMASDHEKEILGHDVYKPLILNKGKGCGYCNETGYSGRIGIYEIMEMTRTHREAINSGANSDILRDISIENGMKTLESECKELVLSGVTTIEELSTIAMIQK